MRHVVTARSGKDITAGRVLYLAFELGRKKWTLGFTTGPAQRPRERTIPAGNLQALEAEIEQARQRFRLSSRAEVVSCYEAGRDGFWLHRYLESMGYTNYIVDSSSLEVKRRAKRVKTDRIDLAGLLRLLLRYASGEKQVWSVVHVPSPEAEDARQLHRELLTLRRDRTRTLNRMKSLLATQGLELELKPGFPTALEHSLLWDGLPVPEQLCTRLQREWQRLLWQKQQVRTVEAERNRMFRESRDPAVRQVHRCARAACRSCHRTPRRCR